MIIGKPNIKWSVPVSIINDKPEYEHRELMIDVVRRFFTGTQVGFSSFMTHDERTYEFIEDVIRETAAISPSKYFHIGGDEADSTPKADYDYFVVRVAKIAEKYNKTPIGWDSIDTSPEINSSVILQNWKDSNEEAVKKQKKD
ncbi:MAG: hypothetical protein E7208_10370 [Clostridium butyricum]|nr:hypothetical protein [Clostridium butyricum]